MKNKNRNGRSGPLETALFNSIVMGDTKKVRHILLEYNVDVNVCGGDMNSTPLHHACHLHKIGIVRLLLEHGADPAAKNEDGTTPLHFACRDDYTAPYIARLLLEHGAKVNAKNKWGNTALHDACKMSVCNSAVEFLIKNGADVNASNKNGHTPLKGACQHRNPQVVKLLLEAGADANREKYDMGTPLEVAMQLPHDDPMREEIIDLFREYAPEATLESVLKLRPEDPLREKTLDWYREHYPELVMERWCTAGLGMGI